MKETGFDVDARELQAAVGPFNWREHGNGDVVIELLDAYGKINRRKLAALFPGYTLKAIGKNFELRRDGDGGGK